MRIAFDAKRYFQNYSGLGNYSRGVINALSKFIPENQYYLYSNKLKDQNNIDFNSSISIKNPVSFLNQLFPNYWRIKGIINDLQKDKIDIYHGLSNEIPFGIEKTKIKSIVTIHDLIFLHYPKLYNPIDRVIYLKKIKNCIHANSILATSIQTKNDLINLLKFPESLIDVVYQSCNPNFYKKNSTEIKETIKQKYQLPSNYILSVGTIEKRKNVLSIIKALHHLKSPIPLVIIGKPTTYKNEILEYIRTNKLTQIYFLNFVNADDLPAIYQMATIFVYPSLYEGFGIPLLEALVSEVPVITSKGGCFSETAGPNSLYINPLDIEELENAIDSILSNTTQREKMISEGLKHAQNFDEQNIANNLKKSYSKLIS